MDSNRVKRATKTKKYMEDQMAIGRKIKYFRELRGITQQEMADFLMVSRQSISKWETNLSLPSIAYVLDIANILGIGVEELFK